MPLTDLACRNAKADPSGKPIKMTDSAGLLLFVSPTGARLWRYRYKFEGREKLLSFGPYPDVKLADARGLRDKAKKLLAEGLDPGVKETLRAPLGDTFEAVAKEWLKAQDWKGSHGFRVERRFAKDVFPKIGATAIAELTASQVLEVLKAVEDRAPDIASRLRQHVSAIMRYAVATQRADRDPVADLRGALKPKRRTKHMPMLTAAQMPEFLARLARYDLGGGRTEEQTKLGILLVAHTAVRTNEIRYGKWSEIEGDVWRIPAERMKAEREHVIPLSPQVVAMLTRLKELARGSDWILPGENREDRPSSENRLLFAAYRLGYRGRLTIHGLRATFSTIANESELWSDDAIERQLAHMPQDKVRSAYNRGLRLEERRRLMAWWSDWLDDAGTRWKSPTDLAELLA